jgi:hypothetical protein
LSRKKRAADDGGEIIFSLKHYWRFIDSEVFELKALSQGMAGFAPKVASS